jgi:malate synthase
MNAQAREASCRAAEAGPRLELLGPRIDRCDEVLTPAALSLLTSLHVEFNPKRLELLAERERRQAALDAGAMLDFLPDTASVRGGDWSIAPVPADLLDRRFELRGAVDRKRVLNALNAPSSVFVADFEDTCAPTWENLIRGQINAADAIGRRVASSAPMRGLPWFERTATLMVRPRGWHLPEKHVRIDGEPVCGALFDFAIYLANNAEALARQGTAPYFYLPKLESRLEARLWNDIFMAAQRALGMPRGTVRAVVLIETLPAAFEMEEILYELRDHAAGLDFGGCDYLFSFIKTFRHWPDFVLPDRSSLTSQHHFLRSYAQLLIETCRRRGAQVPFELMGAPSPRPELRENMPVSPGDLLRVPHGEITEAGLRASLRVGVQYLEAWLRGIGSVPLYDRMEDAATAEICRAQLWQCLRHEVRTSDGRRVTPERFDRLLLEELDRIHDEVGPARLTTGVFPTSTRLFEQLIKEPFEEFFTLSAYELLA